MSTDTQADPVHISRPGDFDYGCYCMSLTVRRGPGAGRTIVYCTCGWSHIYKSRKKAMKRQAEHEAMNTLPPLTKGTK